MKTKTHTLSSAEKERIRERLSEMLSSRPDVLFAYVYGSFGDEAPFHDIDVGVCLSETGESPATVAALELSGRMSAELGMPVDVRPLNSASIPFRYHVIRGTLLFEKDQDVTARFIEQTVQRYLDIKPLLLTGLKEAFAA